MFELFLQAGGAPGSEAWTGILGVWAEEAKLRQTHLCTRACAHVCTKCMHTVQSVYQIPLESKELLEITCFSIAEFYYLTSKFTTIDWNLVGWIPDTDVFGKAPSTILLHTQV